MLFARQTVSVKQPLTLDSQSVTTNRIFIDALEAIVLDMVHGQHIEFDTAPFQNHPKPQPIYNDYKRGVINSEIDKLLNEAVIACTEHKPREFVSAIFVRPKKDGAHWMILNLKDLNEHGQYHHFKIETLIDAIRLMTPNCFMASVDLKDAYYSILIAKEHQKYLKFEFEGSL